MAVVVAGVVLASVVGVAMVAAVIVCTFHRRVKPSTQQYKQQQQLRHATGTLSPTYKSFRDYSLDMVDEGNPVPHYPPPPSEIVPFPMEPPSYQHQGPELYHQTQQPVGQNETPSTMNGYRHPSLANTYFPVNHAASSKQNHNNHQPQHSQMDSFKKDELEGWHETPSSVRGYTQYRPSLADKYTTDKSNDATRNLYISRTSRMPIGQQRPGQQQRQSQQQGQEIKEELLYYRLTRNRKGAEVQRVWSQNLPRPHRRRQNQHPDPAMIGQNYWI